VVLEVVSTRFESPDRLNSGLCVSGGGGGNGGSEQAIHKTKRRRSPSRLLNMTALL
jgi:hypothetical protein